MRAPAAAACPVPSPAERMSPPSLLTASSPLLPALPAPTKKLLGIGKGRAVMRMRKMCMVELLTMPSLELPIRFAPSEARHAAITQAKLANKLYHKKFSGPRWEALVKKGAKKQKLLWASTGVKNPAYPDTLYVNSLIGPDTVNTMPDQALQAFIDHGTVKHTIILTSDSAPGIYSAMEKLGIDWDEVAKQLEQEGVDSFKKSFDSVLMSLEEKANISKLVAV
ncbi:hypothetical protein ACP70R_019284 [Stipagrostis hirtigluma subsp. patula]